jgi:hypothetical protein
MVISKKLSISFCGFRLGSSPVLKRHPQPRGELMIGAFLSLDELRGLKFSNWWTLRHFRFEEAIFHSPFGFCILLIDLSSEMTMMMLLCANTTTLSITFIL